MPAQPLISIKQKLLNCCLETQHKRIETFRRAMDEAQQAANSEEKSTAGDKYDTSRAMSQNDRDMNAKQFQEALKDVLILQKINPTLISVNVTMGSVVKTSSGNYFIATSAGQVNVNEETFFAISPTAPLAQVMLNKKAGDPFIFRDKTETIIEVF